MVKDILAEIKKAGVEYAHHYSDLYFPVNETSKKIVAEYEFIKNVGKFEDCITGETWFDVPFAYYDTE